MANPNQDPFQDLILNGNVRTMPYTTDPHVTVLNVNLDTIHNNLLNAAQTVYAGHEPLLRHYSGTRNQITAAINIDCQHMMDYALWVCYNRLRAVAERYSSVTRTTRMNPKAPCSNRMEFPTFISSLLQSIGPLRITDAAHDIFVMYAPPIGTMQTFGRAAAAAPIEIRYNRLITALRACGVPCSAIDVTPNFGAYWTTCQLTTTDNLINVVGTVHPSHYTNDDIVKCFVLDPNRANNPFEDVCLTAGYVEHPATLRALAAAPAPENLPPGQTAASAGRPSGFIYNVNYFGIRPAVAAGDNAPARVAGCYVLGRGVEPIFTCYLAQHLSEYEISAVTRHKLLH